MKSGTRARFVNLFPNNITQNRYRRALKTVASGMETDFSKAADKFSKKMKDFGKLDNPYTGGFDD
jgi:hypothetical protein